MKMKFKFRRHLLEEEKFDAEGQKLPGDRCRSLFARVKKAVFVEEYEGRQKNSTLARPLLKGELE